MTSLQQKTVEEIEFAIMSGEFRPRQRLVESELVERFKVGRTIIRESLRILEDRGLVLIHSNKGASVVDFTARDITDIYFLRVKMESVVCMLAFNNLTGAHVNEMRQLQKKLKETNRANRELVTIHESFHDVIFRAADNEFLRRQIKRLISLTGAIRYFSYTHTERRRLTINQHDEIIAAIEEGDKKKFVSLCLDHLSLSLEAHLKIFHPTEAQALIKGYHQAMARTMR